MQCILSFLSTNFIGFLIGLIAGGISSIGVWYFIFHRLVPVIKFSESISKTTEDGNPAYSFKFENSGKRKAIDLQINIRFRVKGLNGLNNWKTVYIPISEDEKDQIPLLSPVGKKPNDMRERRPLLINHAKFDQEVFPPEIREKAKQNKLTLEELFDLGQEGNIQINIFCYDEFSGTRKLFSSPKYNKDEIKEGKFEKNSLEIA